LSFEGDPGLAASAAGFAGAMSSCTKANASEHSDSLPAASVAWAYHFVVVFRSARTWNPEAKSSADPSACGPPVCAGWVQSGFT